MKRFRHFGRLVCRVCSQTHNRKGSDTLYELTESKLLKTSTWGLMHYDCGSDMIKFLSSRRSRFSDANSYTLKHHKRNAK